MVAIFARAYLQIFLTMAALATAVTSFALAFVFEDYVDQMTWNHRGDIRSVNLPCIRATLDRCDNALVDKCWVYCCPPKYQCQRSPIVGLMCKAGNPDNQCEDHNLCRDFADISGTCYTQVCKTHKMVVRVTKASYILASFAIFLDLIDIITMYTLPHAVVFKSALNVFSSLVKHVAYGCVLGAGTQGHISELETAKCFNSDGQKLVSDAGSMFVSFAIMQVTSACISLVLAPFSAYYGGKLQGVPYVK